MKGKISEIRTAIVLVFITIAVGFAGLLLYRNLSRVSEEVSGSYQKISPPSETVRQITVEFRDAENSIRSYNLTRNDEFLIDFFKTASLIEDKMSVLKKSADTTSQEGIIIERIISLCEQRFTLMKTQLFLDDEKDLTNELNVISGRIKKNTAIIQTPVAPKDTVKEERPGFFSRLFGKKKKSKPEVATITEDPVKTQQRLDSLTAEINATVQYVKKRQLQKIENRQNAEMKAETESKYIMDRIHTYYLKLEGIEKVLAQNKIEAVHKKVDHTKDLGIMVSIIISLLLLIVSWSIVFYSRKKAEYEKALIKAKQEAEDLAKTKEMFLANMSHEIKTPLNAIYGFTDQVLRSGVEGEQKDQLTVVKKSATHLINLITDILSYSKIQSGRMKLEISDLELREELKELESLFRPITNKKNIELIIETSPSVPAYIKTDLTKLKQVLMNIMGNAIKFTEKGSVIVKVEKDEEQTGPVLQITISDTGIGIPAEKLPLLFNEYEQAHPELSKKLGETGLGLVITKKLVELMGGIVRLESEEGHGTTTFITIPFTIGTKPKLSHSEQIAGLNAGQLHSKKVLIADDEEYNRLLLKTILSKYKVKVYEATDGAEAVKMIRDTPVDVVLMDLHMPIKNGIEACKEIRQLPGMDKDHPSILVSSAVNNEEKAEELKQAGFNGSLFKPFTEEELISKLIHFTGGSAHTETFIKPSEPVRGTGKLNFENIESIANGDEAFKKEMIGIFHRSINNGTEQLKEACNRKSWQEVSDIAHKMMPPCKHFEAIVLYEVLSFFENIPHENTNLREVEQKLGELATELQEVNSQLKIYL